MMSLKVCTCLGLLMINRQHVRFLPAWHTVLELAEGVSEIAKMSWRYRTPRTDIWLDELFARLSGTTAPSVSWSTSIACLQSAVQRQSATVPPQHHRRTSGRTSRDPLPNPRSSQQPLTHERAKGKRICGRPVQPDPSPAPRGVT